MIRRLQAAGRSFGVKDMGPGSRETGQTDGGDVGPGSRETVRTGGKTWAQAPAKRGERAGKTWTQGAVRRGERAGKTWAQGSARRGEWAGKTEVLMMWECECGGEPMDYRLLWLRFMRKLWILPVAVVLGAVLVGSVYYYSRTAARGGRTYQAESIYYIDFAENSLGEEYDYYNYFTWGEVIHTDFFLNYIYEKMDGELSMEELEEYVSATVDSDVRYLYVRCNTHSPELSVRLASILEEIVPQFAGVREEIASIELVKAGDTAKDSSKIRLGNALFLGAGLGLGISVFGILVALILDTAVYLPSTLERRYHVVCLGAPFMPEFRPNWEKYLAGASRTALVCVDEGTLPEELADLWGDQKAAEVWQEEKGIFAGQERGSEPRPEKTQPPAGEEGIPEDRPEQIVCRNPVEHPEELEKLRSCDKTVLCLKAGCKNHETFVRLLEQLARQEIPVTAAVLLSADERLVTKYYRSRK